MDASIGERVTSSLRGRTTQRALARAVGMTEDSLSRAIRGQRGFAAIEAAAIAEHLGVDAHWLITGRRDPFHVTPAAARHFWNSATRSHENPGVDRDGEILRALTAAYAEAFPGGPPPSRIPGGVTAGEVRAMLGRGFVEAFAERVESLWDIDVVRRSDISTDYSFSIGDRAVIVLATTPNWFRSNWSLAHELGHLVLAHRPDVSQAGRQEREANAFAADLLMPAGEFVRVGWESVGEEAVARFLWEHGVSNESLTHRLASLAVPVSSVVTDYLAHNGTKAIVRSVAQRGAVVNRELAAAAARPAAVLAAALEHRVEGGEASPASLAWLLDVPVDELDWPEPDDDAAFADYRESVAQRPSALSLIAPRSDHERVRRGGSCAVPS